MHGGSWPAGQVSIIETTGAQIGGCKSGSPRRFGRATAAPLRSDSVENFPRGWDSHPVTLFRRSRRESRNIPSEYELFPDHQSRGGCFREAMREVGGDD